MSVVIKSIGKTASKAAKVVGNTVDDVTEKVARKAINVSEGGILKSSIKEAGEEQLGNLAKKKINKAGGIDNLIKNNNLKKNDVINIANDLGIKTNSKTTKKDAVSMINEKVKESVPEVTEKVKSSRGKNALIGSAVGGISGAGIGGIAGMATGADEDNQNGMIVTGALAGIAGGAMVGGLFGNNITKVAGGIAKGASNEAVEGGAKGLLKNAGASTQNFADKIDDIGENISKKFNKDFIDQNSSIRKEMAYRIKKNQGGTAQEALEKARNITDAMSSGSYEPENVMEQMVGNIYNDNVAKIRHGNAIGGAAQGAIMGSVSGAVVGGVAGGIDEDDTFIGGALKGGLIGGTLGGIGGGVSGYFNNNAKLLANTTANVNSLLGK